MRAALELGRWVFLAPLGYINAPRAMGKSLLQDPERAPIIRKAFEDYGTGRVSKQQILERVNAAGLRNRRNRPLSSQAIGMLLRNQLYAGVIDVPRRHTSFDQRATPKSVNQRRAGNSESGCS